MNVVSTCLMSVLLATIASGSEYVTLTEKSLTKTVAATDLVEIVGYSGVSEGTQRSILLNFADGAATDIIIQGFVASSGGGIAIVNHLKGNQFTGLTRVTIGAGPGNNWALTLKITSRAEREEVTSGVVTLPGVPGASYTVTMEKSTNLADWQPTPSGEVTGTATPQFFRVRIAANPAP